MPKKDRDKYPCSFCGEKASDDNIIITAGKVSICASCILLGYDIIKGRGKKKIVLDRYTVNDFLDGEEL